MALDPAVPFRGISLQSLKSSVKMVVAQKCAQGLREENSSTSLRRTLGKQIVGTGGVDTGTCLFREKTFATGHKALSVGHSCPAQSPPFVKRHTCD